MTRLLALAFCCLLGGCFVSRGTINDPISTAKVDGLEVGVSTSADVLKALGAPTDVVQLGSESAWRYDFTSFKRAGLVLIIVSFLNEDTRSDRVWVFFDEEGVLRNIGSTFQGKDAVYAMPWADIHE